MAEPALLAVYTDAILAAMRRQWEQGTPLSEAMRTRHDAAYGALAECYARAVLALGPNPPGPAAGPSATIETAEAGSAFRLGDYVEKYTGEARWSGWVRSVYRTRRGGLRYVVEIDPQGFQMIASQGQLRSASLVAEARHGATR